MNEVVSLNDGGVRPTRIDHPVEPRLARMRFLSRLLDNSILLPGGYRIGIDPLIGLIPAVGDFVAATLSVWLIYDAARLGVAKRTLARMALNVIIETAVGAVPVIGDLIDAAWKANARNMQLVEAAYKPGLPRRSVMRLGLFFIGTLVAIYGALVSSVYFALKFLLSFF